MIDALAILYIVEKIADFAKVLRHFDFAIFASFCNRLDQLALHALHFFRVVSVHDVVGIVVVAKTACKRDVATSCNDFALAVVVLAAQTVVVYVNVLVEPGRRCWSPCVLRWRARITDDRLISSTEKLLFVIICSER